MFPFWHHAYSICFAGSCFLRLSIFFCSVQLWDYNAKIYDVFTAYFFSSKIILTKLSLLGYAYKFAYVALVTWFKHIILKNIPMCHLCFEAQDRFCLCIHVSPIYLCLYSCTLKMETTASGWFSGQAPGICEPVTQGTL